MINPHHPQISISRQCELLGKSRSWYYYTPGKDEKRIEQDAYEKKLIQEVSSDFPFYGYRKVALEVINRFGTMTSFKRTYRLWKQLGFHAVQVPIPTSTPRRGRSVYPYLLDGLKVTHINHVWQIDITYTHIPHGTMFLCAIIDVYSRKVLSWNLSNTMDAYLVLWPLTWALERYGIPDILNSDQGSQFTTETWVSMAEDCGILVSMNSKGRSRDNIYIERWWRSFKYEDLYLRQYRTVPALRKGIADYIDFYNTQRFHQSLNYKRPDEVYYGLQGIQYSWREAS